MRVAQGAKSNPDWKEEQPVYKNTSGRCVRGEGGVDSLEGLEGWGSRMHVRGPQAQVTTVGQGEEAGSQVRLVEKECAVGGKTCVRLALFC